MVTRHLRPRRLAGWIAHLRGVRAVSVIGLLLAAVGLAAAAVTFSMTVLIVATSVGVAARRRLARSEAQGRGISGASG